MFPSTEVRLLSNVPLSQKYEHQLTFDSTSEQTAYFLSKSAHTFTDFSYQRDSGSITIPKSFEAVNNCNYIMFKNSDYSVKWWYAFITDKQYVNPNTCRISFEIDVYQTWQFNLQFKPSFIEREHCDRWNLDGSPKIYTVDEGLDYGAEYDTVDIQNYVPYGDNYFLVIVCKNRMDVNGTDIQPIVNGSPQPLTYYLHPFKLDGTSPNTTWSGVNQTVSPVMDVLKALYKNTSAVNNIVSLYITEHVGVDFTYDSTADNITFPSTMEPVNIQDGTTNFVTYYVASNSLYNKSFVGMGGKYDGYSTVYDESKLLMYPYTVLVMDDFKGGRIEYKNEYINSQNLILTVRGSMGTSNKVVYTLEDYNSTLTGTDLQQLSMEHSIINDSPNDVPIITDLLSAYLQGNRNQIQNQKNSILFNQATGLVGNVARGNVIGGVSDVGNSYLQMQGILAKQQDINNTPPNIAKMGSNTAFDFGNDYTGVYLMKKQIKHEYRLILSEFFKMFGYKINRVKQPNLKTRQHFNYIRTIGCNIVADIPSQDLLRIKEMFDNGVTLWHGDWVCDYSLANGEI